MARTPSKRPSRRVSLPALVAPFLALAVLVIVGFTAQPSRAGGNPPPPPPPGQLGPSKITSGPVYKGPYGIPAIQPRASLANSANAHFTAADAAAYVKANRAPFTVAGTPDPTIVSIVFLPAKTVVAEYGGSLSGTTDSTPICVVTLSGTFLIGSGPLGGTPIPYHQGHLIFDGFTGYLLASSVG